MKILHLEDDRQDAALVEAMLASDGLDCDLLQVETEKDFVSALRAGDVDLILADDNLPSFDGMSAFGIAQELSPDTPFIFLSGTFGEDVAIERLKAGATDSVMKQRIARLPSSVRRALRESAERVVRRNAEAQVRRLNANLEQRVAERTAQLAESERRLQAILDHAPASIYLKDAAGVYLVINHEFERAFGVARKDVTGKTDADLFPSRIASTYRDNDRQVLHEGRGREIEEPVIQPDGVHTYRSIRFPLVDTAGRSYAVCGIATDITERKKADDELRMARLEAERASAAKSQFLSRMSHDLRTPLNAILGFAQLLEVEDVGTTGRESVSQILRGGQHLLQLINEVLDIARIEAGHLSLSAEPVNAVEIVQQAMELVRPLASERGISVKLVAPTESEVIISADRQRLNQILLNLLSNAVKYNRPNGQVAIAFEPAGDRRCMRITITDTGAGIPPAKMALLFQPFERLGAEYTRIEGTGLGLAVSRGLAEAMDGSIGVKSEIDLGSTFWVELALSDKPQARQSEPLRTAAHATPARASGLVLYIEDNSSNVRLMERVFERRPGVRLLHAGTGEDGLRLARDERPNLIFLDLHLPDMAGEEVLRCIWEDPQLRPIPVAVLSADATSGHARRVLASGAVAYLTKPLDLAQVIGLIDQRLSADPQDSAGERRSQ